MYSRVCVCVYVCEFVCVSVWECVCVCVWVGVCVFVLTSFRILNIKAKKLLSSFQILPFFMVKLIFHLNFKIAEWNSEIAEQNEIVVQQPWLNCNE